MTAVQTRPGVTEGDIPLDESAATAGSFGGSPATPRVLIVGLLPECGASSIAWSVACAAADLGGPVLVSDAASPRRSQLRGLAPLVGATHYLDDRLQLVDGSDELVTVRFVRATHLDLRADAPQSWPEPVAGTTVHVVDPGVSAEDALVAGVGNQWLCGPVAASSCVVAVLPTAAAAASRCEAVLSQWASSAWAPIDHVIAVGEQRKGAADAAPLLAQAMQAAQRVPYLAQLQVHGLPPLAARADPSVQSWASVGSSVIDGVTGRPTTSPKKRRWGRHST